MKRGNFLCTLAGIFSLAGAAPFAVAAAAESDNLIGVTDVTGCTADAVASTTVPGWTTIAGSPSLLCTPLAGFTTPESAPLESGLISSGPYGSSSLERIVDVSGAQAPIDQGAATYTLSAWLHASGSRHARTILTMTFRDAGGQALGGAARLDSAAAAGGAGSAFEACSASGAIPRGARSLRVVLRLLNADHAGDPAIADRLSLKLQPALQLPPPPPPRSTVPRFAHVFLIVMENTNYEQVIGDTRDAPFINGLAGRGTLLARYTAVYHPSDQNYLAIAAGDTAARGPVYFPDIHIASRHLGDTIESADKTWKAYEQGMGAPCNTTAEYDKYYEPDDAPFVNFNDVIGNLQRCQTHLFDTNQLASDLQSVATTPDFAWLAADDYDDGEKSGNGSPTSLRVQDAWLKRTLTPIFASPAWRTGLSLVILTWDESVSERTNHVAAILIGSQGSVRAGFVSHTRYDHYSTGRTIEEALGLPSLTANDAYARPINDAFAGAKEGP
jgi:hypothetical protein